MRIKKKIFFLIIILLFNFCSPKYEQKTIEDSPSIIALLSDWGESDFYSGAVKGVILSINPKAKVLDISHNIPSFDIRQASAQLYFSSREFPEGTIFIADVDPGPGLSRPILVITKNNKYFIGPDNGIFTLIYENLEVQKVIHLKNKKYMVRGKPSYTFFGRDIFAPIAAWLSKGISINKFGKEIKNPVKFKIIKAHIKNDICYGEILFIDRYGNVITNISRNFINQLNIKFGNKVKLKIGNNEFNARFVNTYAQGELGEFICLISSTDTLEIAVNMGKIIDYFLILVGDPVEIRKIE
ncbi:SAM-dependent chlorinase/fluorinase [Candidatus Aminicenantes bacterium AH-873-B07]|nr:SAM-dependent chlorinase/fluorinase [Candidatus Aminicenantes bacterium AH-873-B07]